MAPNNHRNRTSLNSRKHARSSNGNGNHTVAIKVPTLEELRHAYEKGLPQTLLSGVQVQMRPVQPDKLLASGKVPEILQPLVMNMMFPPEKEVGSDVFPDEVGDYLYQKRDKSDEILEFVKSVDVVCEAALIDPSIVPYLSVADRMWIFKLAFMPVAVLSTFRLQPNASVESGDGKRAELLPTQRDDAGDRVPVPVESADRLPV